MKILIVSAVFPPEPMVSARTSFEIANALLRDGHQVTVFAPFPSRPDGVLFAGFRRSLYRKEVAKFRLIRCFSLISKKSTMMSRMMENISFAITSSVGVLCQPRADALYVNSWAIFGMGLVSLAAWLRGIPAVISIQDVYPESLAEQKRISTHSAIYRVLRWLDGKVVRSAKAIIVLSDRFRETYAKDRGVPANRIHVVENWGEDHSRELDVRGAYGVRRKYGISDQAILAVYGGNIGAAAGVETVIHAFEYLWNEDDLYLLIAGTGSRLAACQTLVKEKRLQNRVFFYTPWPKEHTGVVLGAADILLLPTQGNQSLVSVPSKLISYMLSGHPVLAMVHEDSDTAALIRKAQAGWIIPPDDPAQTASALKSIASSAPEELRACGTRGLDYALSNLSREENLSRILRILSQIGRRTTPPAAMVHEFKS